MLNNNFSKLIKLYEKYRRKQRNKMILKVLALFVVLAALYLLFLQNRFSSSSQPATPKTAPVIAQTTSKNTHETVVHNTTQPVTPTRVATPKEENMPTAIQKRTPAKNGTKAANEPMQLKIMEREGLYKMLVDYKDNKSYRSAIKIAQFYLLQKEYEKAVKWAVEASKKDPSQAQSWIIYAKAKKALGKPEMAKRALTIYLKHNYSPEAKALLESLR